MRYCLRNSHLIMQKKQNYGGKFRVPRSDISLSRVFQTLYYVIIYR